MSQYCFYADLVNGIDQINLAAMTQDFGSTDNTVNYTILNNICQMASNQCDALVSSIYSPFGSNPPAKIKQAAIIFSMELLYARRLTPDEKNSWKSQADYWRETLTLINGGKLDLDESFQRGVQPVIYKSYPSRNNSNIF